MSSYKAFAVDKHGERKEINAESIVIELAEDRCLELDLNPHPNHAGGLPISTCTPSEQPKKNINGVYSMFNIKLGACNVVHLYIENVEVKDF